MLFMIRAMIVSRLSPLIHHLTDRPAAALVSAFSLGIAFSPVIREYSFAGFVLASVSLIWASSLALRQDRLVLSLALGLSAICSNGLLIALAHRDGFSDSDLRSLLSHRAFRLNEPVSFEGCVTEDSEKRGEESSATIELDAFLQKDKWIPSKGKGMIRIAGYDSAEPGSKVPELLQGDQVRGWAVWRLPRNYGNPGSADRRGLFSRRGIFLLGRTKSPRLLESLPGGCSNIWTKMAVSVRDRVRKSLEPIRAMEKGQPAAVLASLVVGDYSRLDNTTREVFQNSGTFHVLVVSGLHVAWIAGLLLQFFKLIRLPERIRYLLAALAILFYTCVVGFQASITRCLWMFILYLIGRIILRRADSVNILLVSALFLLAAQPDWLFEVGFHLSFLSVMAIAMTAVPAIESYLKPVLTPLQNSGNSDRYFLQPGPWHRRGRKLRARCEIFIEEVTDSLHPAASGVLLRICRAMAGAGLATGSMIVISLSIQIWIEPVLAYNFNRMSWISPLANLVIVPFSSLVLAAGIATSLAAGLPFCGPALVHFAGALSSLFLRWTTWITTAYGAWQRCPTPSAPWILGGILLLFAWSFFKWRRFWIPCVYVVLLLACLSCGCMPGLGTLITKYKSITRPKTEQVWQKDTPVLSFTFLDVGQGDSIFIRFPNKGVWLLDAGGLLQSTSRENGDYAFDIGEAVVSRYLWHAWITRLDRLILSHSDLDHAGGAPAILRNFQVGRLDYPQAVIDEVLAGILNIAREKQISENRPHAGMQEKIGPVTVRAIHPPAKPSTGTANDNSLVLHFSFKRFSALLTGDLEKKGETEALSHSADLRSLLLKVAHHGSRSATSIALLNSTQPRWAVVSVGRNNPYHHPSPEVMLRLTRHGARSFLTLDEGAITFETDGDDYAIRSHVSGILERGRL